MKKIVLFSVFIFSAIFFLGGCTFLTPEDDLNGNNEEKKEFIKKLDMEKKEETSQKDSQLGSQGLTSSQKTPIKKEVKKEKIDNSSVLKEIGEEKKEENLDYAEKYSKATIVTNYGDIRVEFFNEDAPQAVGNFLRLADEGFYDDTKFHRVIEGFMIQAGDPNSKDNDWTDDGIGGPGYKFDDEINDHKLVRGSLAMANSGVNTNGSQFFIVTSAETPQLDGKHTNFGKVFEGMDTVDKIENVRIDENSHPTQDVVIEEIGIR
jgi:peptidyl-prolyl cis-trans isomerase B (cyclophilin B)